MKKLGGLTVLALLLGSLLPKSARAQDAGVDKKTERTWKAKCASCHGADGKGQTEQGKKNGNEDMTTAEWQKRDDAKLKETIDKGFKREKDGKKQEMDAFGKDLKPEQIDALVKYIRAFAKK